MATTRLTFLYPHLFRTAAFGDTVSQAARRPSPRPPSTPSMRSRYGAPFASSSTAKQSMATKRHGKAVEPIGLHGASAGTAAESKRAAAIGVEGSKAKAATESAKPQEVKPPQDILVKAPEQTTKKNTTTPLRSPEPGPATTQPTSATAASTDLPTTDGAIPLPAPTAKPPKDGPMEAILHMQPPSDAEKKPPHLTPPPYVHHFDSHSLVKQLQGGGFTPAQAITAMKAVRGLLAVNLDVAQAGLVSKSDTENETYLFRAACSELSTEVRKNRRAADEAMRQQRTTLGHEVDIFTQSLNQEALTLNDNVRGMFNDRRMAVREQQKEAESAIQQINYKISVMLNSDAKSEIESLRWILIRRCVTGIVIMAILTFGTLRYGSYLSHKREQEKAEQAREAEALRKAGGRKDHSSAPDAVELLAAN